MNNSSPNTEKTPDEVVKDIGQSFWDLLDNIRAFFVHLIDLREGSDIDGTIKSIRANKEIKGSNVWLLFCSIMIASIGLDLNSPAVIIGAMLISPLMSPILGAGLSIGINDRAGLWMSMRHLSVAVFVALLTSFLYFLLTPLKGPPTSEMLGRTAPTLLDVGVALFGGVAGFVSASRAEKSNAIPGVAIATALLPPLCVSGYGLANAEWTIFFNSFYLFFLNSVFVALATYMLTRFLRFPYKEHINVQERKRAKWIIVAFVLIVIIPSGSILYNVIQEVNMKRQLANFVQTHLIDDSHEHHVLKWELIDYSKTSYLRQNVPKDSFDLKVYVMGDSISKGHQDTIANYLKSEKSTRKVRLNLIHIGLSQNDLNSYQEGKQEMRLIASEVYKDQINKEQQRNKNAIDSLRQTHNLFKSVRKDLQLFYPEIQQLNLMADDKDSTTNDIPLVIVDWNATITDVRRKEGEERIVNFVKKRCDFDTIKIIRYD